MRSTNLVIFLVLLNITAGIISVMIPDTVVFGVQSGAIETANQQLSTATVNQPSADEITGSFLANARLIQTIDNIIFIGPNMLGSLGLPSIFVTGLKSVIGFVVAFDVAEAVTGRLFS
jgi:hypothetical protein